MKLTGLKCLVVSVFIWLCPGLATAEIYKWIDENGNINYSDSKPENREVTEIEFPVSTYDSVSYGTVQFDSADSGVNESPARKRVVMFSASWCGVCKKAKSYFQSNGIPFTEYDIEKSNRGKSLYRKLGATGVPVILVGNKRMNGFTQAGFQRLYR